MSQDDHDAQQTVGAGVKVPPPPGAGMLPALAGFATVASAFDRGMRRWMPDPLVLAIAFTIIIFLLGLALTDTTPVQMVAYWGEGFWRLLELAMQFVLVLCTGFILAISPAFKKVLGALARLSHTPGSAIINVTLVALAASWINWAFGLVIGALYAKEMIRHVPGVNFRLLIASAYSGFIVWHGGLGGSIPLLVNTPGHFAEATLGLVPTSQTIFSAYNIFIVITLIILVPLLNRMMMGAHANDEEAPPQAAVDTAEEEQPKSAMTPAERIENSMVISMTAGALGLGYLVYYFSTRGFDLNINIVNFVFLTLAIIFSGTPRRFLDGLQVAVRGVGGIVVQFPFYAGIMGMMGGSGLVEVIAGWFLAISNETTYPFWAMTSAAAVNFAVPSGGGQWAVQGPIVLEATGQLGLPTSLGIMTVAMGDQLTNMIQPFWALPLLGITGLRAGEVLGYTAALMIVIFVVASLSITFLA
jgi:short-chain fatty acids transporter